MPILKRSGCASACQMALAAMSAWNAIANRTACSHDGNRAKMPSPTVCTSRPS